MQQGERTTRRARGRSGVGGSWAIRVPARGGTKDATTTFTSWDYQLTLRELMWTRICSQGGLSCRPVVGSKIQISEEDPRPSLGVFEGCRRVT